MYMTAVGNSGSASLKKKICQLPAKSFNLEISKPNLLLSLSFFTLQIFQGNGSPWYRSLIVQVSRSDEGLERLISV